MRTHQGLYKVKNPSKYRGDSTNVVFRSSWEQNVMAWCDTNKDIKEWSSEEVVIPYLYEITKRHHRYFMDFYIHYKDGTKLIVEVKPKKQTIAPKKPKNKRDRRYISEATTYVKNRNKWDAAREYALDRGWKFEIWTEDTLKAMGILKTVPGKLKPYKPYKPYRAKKKR